jgi:hypothetical protein
MFEGFNRVVHCVPEIPVPTEYWPFILRGGLSDSSNAIKCSRFLIHPPFEVLRAEMMAESHCQLLFGMSGEGKARRKILWLFYIL